MNIRVHLAALALLAIVPAMAAGQEPPGAISLQGTLGAQLGPGGHGESVALGISPSRRLTILVGAERLHTPTERSAQGATRGGTSTLVTGELRIVLVPRAGLSPYVSLGFGRGISRPNVNDIFPDPVRNTTGILFLGAGVRADLTPRISASADVRLGFQAERDTLGLVVPVRGGLAWRF